MYKLALTRRTLFDRFKKQKCGQIEPLFRKFQQACEDQITALEKSFDKGSLNHLL